MEGGPLTVHKLAKSLHTLVYRSSQQKRGDKLNFREWFRTDENAEERINSLIDGEGYILFFKKDGDIFAADEDSRVVFAKMKNPDDEMPANWEEEANFSAHNMQKLLRGEPGEHIFSKKDLKEIEVVTRESVVEDLKKDVKDLGDNAFKPRFKIIDIRSLLGGGDPDEAPNFIRADER